MGQPQSTISKDNIMIQPQDLVPGKDDETSIQPEKIVTPQNPTTEAREGQMACDNQEIESNMQKIGGLLKNMHDAAIDKCEDIRAKLKVVGSDIGKLNDSITKACRELTLHKEETNETDVVPKEEIDA